VRISQLEGHAVALWGWGREARAAHAAIRARLPSLPLTLLCGDDEAAQAAELGDPLLTVLTQLDAATMAAFEVVVKSPGISPYTDIARFALARGTRFVGGTTLCFDEHPEARTVCITGTKGKSTSTALLAQLLRSAGHRTALAGNIGVPLLELNDVQPPPAFWAIELSSFQTRDVAAAEASPEVAVVLNLYPEHLDWHGSQGRYIEDKLTLVTAARPRIALLNAADPLLAGLSLPHSEVRWFNREDGWHLRGKGLHRGERFVLDTAGLPLPGAHNRSNLCAVLAAIEALGLDAAALAPAVRSFRPLPNRLQSLGARAGIRYVNDSISTTPHASLAALECFAGERVAILLGGHDRGLDWSGFAAAMSVSPPLVIVTMGANGDRINALLQPLAVERRFQLAAASDLAQAVATATALLEGQGLILLSPGAPSFGQYRDYQARGRHFAEVAGLDPRGVGSIQGLGIA